MRQHSTRAASAAELAVLNHPDQRTSWIVVTSVTLEQTNSDLLRLSRQRLHEISEHAHILRSRWQRGGWRIGSPPEPIVVQGDPIHSPVLLRRFELEREPPARLLVSADGGRLALATHHAALDGRGMAAIIGSLFGQPLPAYVEPPQAPRVRPRVHGRLRRVISPADRVAPSDERPARESFAMRDVVLRGPNVTGAIAAACVAAVGARNARLGWPWRRIGLSLALGGPPAIGNVASYRRLDLGPGDAVSASVQTALRSDEVPLEQVTAPRALRALAPIVDRLSDSLLISNLGRSELQGVKQFALFPVARGGSAVAFGATGLRGGGSTLSLRARDLDAADARSLLDAAVRHLHAHVEIPDGSLAAADEATPTQTGAIP